MAPKQRNLHNTVFYLDFPSLKTFLQYGIKFESNGSIEYTELRVKSNKERNCAQKLKTSIKSNTSIMMELKKIQENDRINLRDAFENPFQPSKFEIINTRYLYYPLNLIVLH